ncbi:NADH-quinone oxidoreductase subunit A [Deinococcus radiodurans R1 = ATCC 13939 = DSM 20539]|uniref:NADH-quinone oxidoreductase subunit A n=2 Tax=Deinococcus radiodurans TaxID=1299 RepID=Q9RU86_DEIRA|nr:NADH dehydrogenase I, A subunit [Deinococcus radiodurans R1 = ATCC 13939 = DSM 20539]QEM70950.1 NADH-quinone oxidoreductase subunit A [Deinococcus radiodurans]UDL00604.1 NADH-quinone oxidoreductase subunit A [Deinococcus radiodurans R1 = ATCC 13939 = DSM 20539]UID70484.1 NADH-quinone oxidoreductase subunit A [Deinococcus radiodurans R1 = ATCC 13939 = DSM 20539]HCE64463.1 NADH-quinone oxidoreductase subunit A [Deinococcus radiodurans]
MSVLQIRLTPDRLSFFAVVRASFHELSQERERLESGGRKTIVQYANFLIMLLVGIGIGILAIVVSGLLGPKKATRTKLMAYESGNDPERGGVGTGQRFPVHFYLVAMLFIVFDIETAFFYPLAVAYQKLPQFAFFEALTFVLLLLVGYVYVLKKKVLEWA